MRGGAEASGEEGMMFVAGFLKITFGALIAFALSFAGVVLLVSEPPQSFRISIALPPSSDNEFPPAPQERPTSPEIKTQPALQPQAKPAIRPQSEPEPEQKNQDNQDKETKKQQPPSPTRQQDTSFDPEIFFPETAPVIVDSSLPGDKNMPRMERSDIQQTQSDPALSLRPELNPLLSFIGKAQSPPWLRHAVPVSVAAGELPFGGKPLIAIIIDDFGFRSEELAPFLALPAPLTFAFLPYAPDLATQTAQIREAGHEMIVHVPMQPDDLAHDPGPNGLEIGMNPQILEEKLQWALSSFDGYVGINNHMGSSFTADREGMRVVMDILARRGLLFLDSLTTAKTTGPYLARELGVPYARRDIFLDNERDVDAIKNQLDALEKIAQKQGYAVGIGHPYAATLEALQAWLPGLETKGMAMASLAHVVILRQTAGLTDSKPLAQNRSY